VNRHELERLGEREAAYQRRARRASAWLHAVLLLALAIALLRLALRWW